MKPLNLFYEQPGKRDRVLRYDRYLQHLWRIIRRGAAPFGQMRLFLNLCQGLDQIGVPYRVNDYDYARQHPEELVCIVGKEGVLNRMPWRNPILYGPNVYDHPLVDPQLLERLPIRKIIVTCEWFRQMCEPYWGDKVEVWLSGIDTDLWAPAPEVRKDVDFLIYNKVMWNYERRERELIIPIQQMLAARGLRCSTLRYGYYHESRYQSLLKRSRAMIFLCEHETQGFARLQAQACGVPVLAWDQQGFWEDPSYYPHTIKFGPVTCVPDWDSRCGLKFKTIEEFPAQLEQLMAQMQSQQFDPRSFILENLTLAKCAREYVKVVEGELATL
jgi:glycosyltransferase involved in cell wall biosynthesis